MLDQTKQHLPFLVCDQCQGTGIDKNSQCSHCQGKGIVLVLKDYVLYWGKKIDSFNIFYDKFVNWINRAINLFLILFGLSGLGVLAIFIWQNGLDQFLSFKYWSLADDYKLYFWITFLGNLYLYYRLVREAAKGQQVVKKDYKEESAPFKQLGNWEIINKTPKSKQIDISLSFTETAIEMLKSAWQNARAYRHLKVEKIHILAGATSVKKLLIVFGRLGIGINNFNEKISHILADKFQEQALAPTFSQNCEQSFFYAYLEAYDRRKPKVDCTDILLSATDPKFYNDNPDELLISDLLLDFDLNFNKVFNVVQWISIQEEMRQGIAKFKQKAKLRPGKGMNKAMTAIATKMLNQFSEDLTELASYGYLFPCLGRESEFKEIFRIFEGSRAGVLLVGNFGVGKTSIIEGLAQKMVAEEVPELLQDKRLVKVSVAHLIGGVSPEQAEQRLLAIVNEIAISKNIVLVIENVHELINVGSGAGLDLSGVLAQVMERKSFPIIASTTPEYFVKFLESNTIGNEFSKIDIKEMDLNSAIQVLEIKSGPIEYENNVYFSYAAIDKAATLSQRFMHERYLPEKAIKILEEVAVKVRNEKGEKSIITGEDVASLISGKTNIPLTSLTTKESEKLLNLEEQIHARIIGQEEAVKMVASSLRRARAELREGKRPIANLLFLGPTGVGKTELAKTVAEVYFGNENNMIRLDMSEYQDKSSINRLIGAPVGMEGHEQGGYLTEAVRKNPFSIVLFDEIEKAHPDILNIFLQVMDDGRLTDSKGRTIDFTNTIIIMTSNAGTQYIQDQVSAGVDLEQIKIDLMNNELKNNFRPEFLNRFDGLIIFKPLEKQQVVKIAELMIAKIIKNLEARGITLEVTDPAIAELADKGFDPKFGARPLRRVVQEHIDNLLAELLISGKLSKRDIIIIESGGRVKVEKAEQL